MANCFLCALEQSRANDKMSAGAILINRSSARGEHPARLTLHHTCCRYPQALRQMLVALSHRTTSPMIVSRYGYGNDIRILTTDWWSEDATGARQAEVAALVCKGGSGGSLWIVVAPVPLDGPTLYRARLSGSAPDRIDGAPVTRTQDRPVITDRIRQLLRVPSSPLGDCCPPVSRAIEGRHGCIESPIHLAFYKFTH